MTEYPVEKSLHCAGWGQQKKAAVKELTKLLARRVLHPKDTHF